MHVAGSIIASGVTIRAENPGGARLYASSPGVYIHLRCNHTTFSGFQFTTGGKGNDSERTRGNGRWGQQREQRAQPGPQETTGVAPFASNVYAQWCQVKHISQFPGVGRGSRARGGRM